ncbi:uncharacterized protein LOC108912387 [Anoplophora glabripennis]|uniref:uncharacterized protein LOC108912387 n=1 Tax=Anoplophora glabripennis TaxID=217634 RepID=UPI000874AFFD|nr:uncharacterized protein LOC108912387 [Anoplophora glabripennis]
MASVAPTSTDIKQWQNLWVVKILQFLSTTIGLSVPNLFQYEGLSVLYAGYSLLLCLLHLATQVYSFVIKYRFYSIISLTVTVLDVCVGFITLAANISCITCAIFLKRRKMVKLTGTLKIVEEQLQKKFHTFAEYHDTSLLLQFIAFITLVFILTTYYCTSLTRLAVLNGLEISLMIANNLQTVPIAILIMQVHFCSTNVKCLFQLLHKNMQDTLQPTKNPTNDVSLIDHSIPDAVYFLKKYDVLCDSIDMMSEAFGPQIFFIVWAITVNILIGLNGILKASMMEPQQLLMDMNFVVLITGFIIIKYLVSISNF